VGSCLGGGLPAQVAGADAASTAVGVVSTPFHGVHDEQPDQASRRQEQSGQQQQVQGARVGSTVVPMVTAAFFDVDNTLVKGSSLFLIGRGLLSHGMVRRRDVARFAAEQVLLQVRGEHLGRMQGAQDRALSLGSGLVVDDLVAVATELYEHRVARRLWPQAVALSRQHVAAGHEVWLVSAAPVELVQIIADALGLTGALGTVSEVQHGRWTGHLGSPILHGPAKAVAVGVLAAERGIDLGASHSYSDSVNDRPLLEATGHPHAVNPDRALRRLAQHRGWPIHRHRRDLTAEAKAALVGLRARLLAT